MALKWVNIRSGEKVVAETEPQIAALWASSDHSPNITQGQDFGWRLAPEVVVEMKKIKQSFGSLEHIAQLFRKTVEDISEIDILHYISNKTQLEAAPEVDVADYQDEYDAQIRQLEGKPALATSALTDEELEAELAARRAASQPSTTTTTTEAPSTTTTTTTAPEPPSTDTTTTEPQNDGSVTQ